MTTRGESVPAHVVIVGAGAVGLTYGLALQKAGLRVSVYVREKYAEECRAGMRLYRIQGKRGRVAETFTPYRVYTDAAQMRDVKVDQTWLCMSTTGLKNAIEGDPRFCALLNLAARGTLVAMQPGLDVPAMLERFVPADRVVMGGIAMVSYQVSELLDPHLERPGVAYLFSGPSPFTGTGADVIVKWLKRGDCPANVHKDTLSMMAFGTSTLMPAITALRGAGWKFANMRKGEWTSLAADACAEARAISARELDVSPPPLLGLIKGPTLALITRLAPVLLPFEVEPYLEYHFTKVGDQGALLMGDYIARGEALSMKTDALRTLRSRVHRP